MLGHFGTRGRGHQRRTGGNVEGQRPTAAGSHHIYQLVALSLCQRQRSNSIAHHFNKAGQLRRLLTARGHHGEKCSGFHLRNFACEYLFKRCRGLLASQCRAIFGQWF